MNFIEILKQDVHGSSPSKKREAKFEGEQNRQNAEKSFSKGSLNQSMVPYTYAGPKKPNQAANRKILDKFFYPKFRPLVPASFDSPSITGLSSASSAEDGIEPFMDEGKNGNQEIISIANEIGRMDLNVNEVQLSMFSVTVSDLWASSSGSTHIDLEKIVLEKYPKVKKLEVLLKYVLYRNSEAEFFDSKAEYDKLKKEKMTQFMKKNIKIEKDWKHLQKFYVLERLLDMGPIPLFLLMSVDGMWKVLKEKVTLYPKPGAQTSIYHFAYAILKNLGPEKSCKLRIKYRCVSTLDHIHSLPVCFDPMNTISPKFLECDLPSFSSTEDSSSDVETYFRFDLGSGKVVTVEHQKIQKETKNANCPSLPNCLVPVFER